MTKEEFYLNPLHVIQWRWADVNPEWLRELWESSSAFRDGVISELARSLRKAGTLGHQALTKAIGESLTGAQIVELYRRIVRESGMFEADVRRVFVREFPAHAELLPPIDTELLIADLSGAIVESIRLDDPLTLGQVYDSLVEAGIPPNAIRVPAEVVAVYLPELPSLMAENQTTGYSPREIANLLGSVKVLGYLDEEQ